MTPGQLSEVGYRIAAFQRAPVKRGQTYAASTDHVTVTRVARDGSWADIWVRQPLGANWTKRMPLPFPKDWTRFL